MTIPVIPDDLTASGLVDLLQQYWGLKSDSELARTLGKERGTIHQFCNKGVLTDVKGAIILELLSGIEYLEQQLDEWKSGTKTEFHNIDEAAKYFRDYEEARDLCRLGKITVKVGGCL